MLRIAIFVIRLGFEPKTHSLEGCCSIQLSYRTGPCFCGSVCAAAGSGDKGNNYFFNSKKNVQGLPVGVSAFYASMALPLSGEEPLFLPI